MMSMVMKAEPAGGLLQPPCRMPPCVQPRTRAPELACRHETFAIGDLGDPAGAAVACPGPAAASREAHSSLSVALGVAGAQTAEEEHNFHEYRVYMEAILRPLRVEALESALRRRKLPGRRIFEEALSSFVSQLKNFVTGCDDRKLSKAALRRARGIETGLAGVSERLLIPPLHAGVLAPDDLHGIWYGFSEVRSWRDSKVPQECLLQMLRGALEELSDADQERFSQQALTHELTQPEVHQSVAVGAWPPLCELLGRLPDCVTPAELQEALWQQSFVENPTHAPDHRNYRRFAVLAAQMVAIGVELESDKVELLVQQTLDLDRPWRERRDMLSGILSAASVEDRRQVVRNLDKRFEEHADIDDFEIVCGIAEHIGIEIPREGAIRRCAMRRWALDPKRGGALPVARLIDFVDTDAAIGEDVATNLRSKGRAADAALLLSRLPTARNGLDSGDSTGVLDVSNGDAELARLREILALDEECLEEAPCGSGSGVFGPVEEGAFRLPFGPPDFVGYAETAEAAREAAARLEGESILALGIWKEEAPFWHAPPTLLALCAEGRLELFDLVALRIDTSGAWPDAANRLRALLSNPQILKVVCGEETMHVFAYTLGLGIASTLKRGERDPLGPLVDVRGLMADVLDREVEDPAVVWTSVARRFLGLRLCPEEAGGNWARRPLRRSQLHHAAAEAWTQIPVLRAVCAFGIAPPVLVRSHFCSQVKVRPATGRGKGQKMHVVGQLAPPGRLAWTEAGEVPTVQSMAADRANAAETGVVGQLPPPTRIAVLVQPSAPLEELGAEGLPPGSLVEVFEERFGGMASIAPPGEGATHRWRAPVGALCASNCWECPSWVATLPRPPAAVVEEAERKLAAPPERRLVASRPTAAAAEATARAEALAASLRDSLFDAPAAERLLQRMYEMQEYWP